MEGPVPAVDRPGEVDHPVASAVDGEDLAGEAPAGEADTADDRADLRLDCGEARADGDVPLSAGRADVVATSKSSNRRNSPRTRRPARPFPIQKSSWSGGRRHASSVPS